MVTDELKEAGEAMERLKETHDEELIQREAQVELLRGEHQRQLDKCQDAILQEKLEAQRNAAAAAEREGVLMLQIEEIKVSDVGAIDQQWMVQLRLVLER